MSKSSEGKIDDIVGGGSFPAKFQVTHAILTMGETAEEEDDSDAACRLRLRVLQ